MHGFNFGAVDVDSVVDVETEVFTWRTKMGCVYVCYMIWTEYEYV